LDEDGYRSEARLERSAEDDYDIALSVDAVQSKPRPVKRAYLETLFGTDKSLASVYRKVGKCSLLHEESTINVIGRLRIHVAVQFARMQADTQSKVLDWFRKHPGAKPSKENLKEARRAAGEVKPKPASTSPKHDAVADRPEILRAKDTSTEGLGTNCLAWIRPSTSEPMSTWDETKKRAALQHLNRLRDSLPKYGMELDFSPEAARADADLRDN
jgi:hypothetical protein